MASSSPLLFALKGYASTPYSSTSFTASSWNPNPPEDVADKGISVGICSMPKWAHNVALGQCQMARQATACL
uniref:Uncharacterized protein n=1 Tax=Arundo donax TaxID=35708 RepID=A0A0A9D866_ARUDO